MATLKLSSSQFCAIQLAATRRELATARAQVLDLQAAEIRREAKDHDATVQALLRGAGADPTKHIVAPDGPLAGTVIDRVTGIPVEIPDAPEVTVEAVEIPVEQIPVEASAAAR